MRAIRSCPLSLGINIFFHVDAALVGIVFCTLPVLLVSVELGAVYRRQQHNLLGGIHALHFVDSHVDSSTVGVVVHTHIATLPVNQFLGLSVTVHHLFLFLVVPLADGHTIVVVVGADEDEDGIYRVSVFFLQLVGLSGNVVPLTPADSIDIRGNA